MDGGMVTIYPPNMRRTIHANKKSNGFELPHYMKTANRIRIGHDRSINLIKIEKIAFTSMRLRKPMTGYFPFTPRL